MYKIKDIPDEFLEKLEYDENSPSGLVWKVNIYNKNGKLHTRKGTVAGSINYKNKGERASNWSVKILNLGKFTCHRVIWALFNGKPDKSMIVDHIDGNPLNNKIENLRLVTSSDNNRNSARQKKFQDSYLPNGVTFKEAINGSKTKYNPYFEVHWQDEESKNKNKCRNKCFSINKLGIIPAQYEAIKFRRSKEVNFTERHGK